MSPQVTGDYWAHQPRGLRDIARCLSGFHRAVMSGDLRSGEHVDRCTCGAIQVNFSGYWLRQEYRFHRVSRRASAQLIAGDRQREQSWAAVRLQQTASAALPADENQDLP
jgi:hypothetical protein